MEPLDAMTATVAIIGIGCLLLTAAILCANIFGALLHHWDLIKRNKRIRINKR